MRHASIYTSPRLKRLGALLATGRYLSTMAIISRARIAAVSAAVAELRANGWVISCRVQPSSAGRVFQYHADRIPAAHWKLLS